MATSIRGVFLSKTNPNYAPVQYVTMEEIIEEFGRRPIIVMDPYGRIVQVTGIEPSDRQILLGQEWVFVDELSPT